MALDEALANIGSMQERAASAQRKVWQGKVGKLQAALKNASAAAAGYRDEAKELRARSSRHSWEGCRAAAGVEVVGASISRAS